MKIRLLDWKNTEHFVEIPDDTDIVCGKVVSGDMILFYPIHYDTSTDREIDYFDGSFAVRRKDFKKLDTMTSSYQVFDLM